MFLCNLFFYAAKKYIENNDINPGDMVVVIGLISTCTQGITNSMGTLGDLKKATTSYKSIYSTLDQPTLINPF